MTPQVSGHHTQMISILTNGNVIKVEMKSRIAMAKEHEALIRTTFVDSNNILRSLFPGRFSRCGERNLIGLETGLSKFHWRRSESTNVVLIGA